MSARHASGAGRSPGERLVQVGALVFLAGVVAVVVAVLPVIAGTRKTSADLPVELCSVLLPLGLALALLGLLRGARARRRAARRSSTPT